MVDCIGNRNRFSHVSRISKHTNQVVGGGNEAKIDTRRWLWGEYNGSNRKLSTEDICTSDKMPCIHQTQYTWGSPTAGPNSALQKNELSAVFSDISAQTPTRR